MDNPSEKSTFAIRNIRLFLAFRILFNARFYYPVFTILFLDFGLTLEQFALLNVAWAASVVIFEVPSGAVADIIGRRNLLVFSGILMIVEMALLCFAPRGDTTLLFYIFLVNRIFSGAAEAAASGADEAIAYDTLIREGAKDEWPLVLERKMRYQSIISILVMSLGAAVYDPSLMQHVAEFLGLHIIFTQGLTLRFPLFLTLVMAFGALFASMGMQEPKISPDDTCLNGLQKCMTVIKAFSLTMDAGRWIIYTPFALVIILGGLVFDNCMRMIITLSSQYYRLIQIPEALFGIIASSISIIGLFIPWLSLKLVQRHSISFNFGILSIITLSGLTGMIFMTPVIGLIPVFLIFTGMFMNDFFVSHYLNSITHSEHRATVLSFKGLSFNLAYGTIGILYSVLLAALRGYALVDQPAITGPGLEDLIFVRSLTCFPYYFLITLAGMILFARKRLKGRYEWNQGP